MMHLRKWPLYKRGLVFKERRLSQRTIGFGGISSWVCREVLENEFVKLPIHLDREGITSWLDAEKEGVTDIEET